MFSELYKYLGNPLCCNQYILMAVPEGVQLDSLKNRVRTTVTTQLQNRAGPVIL